MSSTLLIASDRAEFRSAARRAFTRHPFIRVIGDASHADGAVELARHLRPDVVLVDLGPGMDGAGMTQRLLTQTPGVQVVVSASEDAAAPLAALYAGARGSLLDTTEPCHIVASVEAVAAGHAYLSPKMTVMFLEHLKQLPPGAQPQREAAEPTLQNRDLEILRLVADGRSNREIGEQLYLSENTVRTYLTEILSELHLENRVQLAVYALRTGVA